MQADGRTIRKQREECGYKLTAFAELVGLSPSWLSRIERNQANPSPDVLRRIALALHREQEARAAIQRIAPRDEGSDDDYSDG